MNFFKNGKDFTMIKFIHLPSHSNVPLSKCFSASYLRVPCSRFLLRRGKTRIFTLTELLMRKSCKSGISFRQQGRAGHCQSPDLTSSFFIPLLNCSIVQMFKCFSVPSYFRVPCSSVLTSRVKIRIFTLIELLIVIAIIAILAAMLLPALGRARGKAKEISCVGNQKQLSMLIVNYMDEHEQWLPPSFNKAAIAAGDSNSPQWWYNLAGANRKLMVGCPEAKEKIMDDYGFVHYGIATDLFGNKYQSSIKQTQIRYPSETILVGDSSTKNDHNGWNETPDNARGFMMTAPVWTTSSVRFRHGGRQDYLGTSVIGTNEKTHITMVTARACVGFADGHAAAMPGREIAKKSTHPNPYPGVPDLNWAVNTYQYWQVSAYYYQNGVMQKR